MLLAVVLMAGQALAAGTETPGVEPLRDGKDTVTLVGAVVGAIGGVVAAALGVLNYGHALLKDRRKKVADGTYLAMRLAVIFESYADACSEMIYRNDAAYAVNGSELPDWETRLPKLLDFPEDADGWRAMEPNIASKCLGMQSRIMMSERVIAEVVEHEPLDIERAVRAELCDRGLEAVALADTLRLTHHLQPISPVIDSAASLKMEAEKLREQLAERERASSKWMGGLADMNDSIRTPPSG